MNQTIRTTGDFGKAFAGRYGTATAGDWGTATTGKNGTICITSPNNPQRKITGTIDGKKLLPNTPYRLNNLDEFVEVKE